MKIISLAESKRPKNGLFDLFVPMIAPITDYSKIKEYTVERDQDMRLDLIMLSMYDNDAYVLENMDIICYINDIDNPLNVYPGLKLFYPPAEEFENYRLILDNTNNSSKIKNILGVPNKTTRKDKNRQTYLDNNYSLPPVVNSIPKEPVRLQGNNILIGGT